MSDYTPEQDTLDEMVTIAVLSRPDLKTAWLAHFIHHVSHKVADVMREHCDWTITKEQIDQVVLTIARRNNV